MHVFVVLTYAAAGEISEVGNVFEAVCATRADAEKYIEQAAARRLWGASDFYIEEHPVVGELASVLADQL